MTTRTALRWSGYVAIAIAFAVACAFLSNWQFTRNEERTLQLDLVEQNYDAPPVELSSLVAPGAGLDPADQWRPVTLTGRYLEDAQVLVRNRPHGGTSAFEVLVPFRTDAGQVLVIDRGWVPPASDSPDPAAVPAPPAGDVTVVARLRPAESAPTSGRSAPPGQVPTITVDLITAERPIDGEIVRSAYGLLVSEDPAPAVQPQAIAPPSEDPGPHLSYAIQWILFAVMGFIFIWYMIRTERRHRREDAEDAAAAGAVDGAQPRVDASDVVPASLRRRRPGPRDRDMQDEDALLDSPGR